jgi:protein tyrosine phosphatase
MDMTASRNRYANVDPYLNNRVKLQVPEGHNDYINASPIVLKSTVSGTETKFIATQVCKYLCRRLQRPTVFHTNLKCRAQNQTSQHTSGE